MLCRHFCQVANSPLKISSLHSLLFVCISIRRSRLPVLLGVLLDLRDQNGNDGKHVAKDGGDGCRHNAVNQPERDAGEIETADVTRAAAPKADHGENRACHGQKAVPILPADQRRNGGQDAKQDRDEGVGRPRAVLLGKDEA